MADTRHSEEKTAPDELGHDNPPRELNTVDAPAEDPKKVKPEGVPEEVEDEDRFQATDN